MYKYPIGVVDKAVNSARDLRDYTDDILMLYIFAPYEERLARVQAREKISKAKAKKILANEPSPGERHELRELYPDFTIIENYDGKADEACLQAAKFANIFLGW